MWRVCKESKYIYMKNYKVTFNGYVNKERNKRNKEKIYKNNKYIETCIKIYKYMYIKTWKIQIYRSVCRKIFTWKYKL